MSKALAPRNYDAEVDAIKARVAELETEDLSIVGSMNRFADVPEEELALMSVLNEEELAAKGWTRRELRIALYAQKPRAEVPFAMQAAHERTLARTRRHQDEPGGMRINVQNNTFNLPAQAPRRPDSEVIVVEGKEIK